ncbi:hypothetical protein HYH03_015124 [Edaphochlamys debaryana]|uniref:quinolinate synthase n=1 Tax=Edaphochlamys debaryana TaxID=47281 RepID=A0A836BRG3_9CHLO|nr:hypothetical protein HYH03_015124 [Edaphochlamys debaryana]|eukprot:KAG2486160.1 hypothetical protein HYH03_015124 [Edaphochlamys debaryana]
MRALQRNAPASSACGARPGQALPVPCIGAPAGLKRRVACPITWKHQDEARWALPPSHATGGSAGAVSAPSARGPAGGRLDGGSLPPALAELVEQLTAPRDPKERIKRLLDLGASLPRPPPSALTASARVMGCAAAVWLSAQADPATGRLSFTGWSDSELSRGLVALLVRGLQGASLGELEALPGAELAAAAAAVAGPGAAGGGRGGGMAAMLEAALRRGRAAADPGSAGAFPSLRITADALTPQGAFAEAQARYLRPDPAAVSRLAAVLAAKRIGVVAHFYMDPQVQGVLAAAAQSWPHVAVSDSLVMADTAVRMAEQGCRAICVLGVDFMSENVRAILDEAGHTGVRVYRLAEEDIGCSLAEAAESAEYMGYLEEAGRQPNSVHVVYINTSLRTKALAHAAVPTITCTSSNVVQTVLAAFAEIPDAHVWYGPDSYMGANLAQFLSDLAALGSEADVQALHPGHSLESIRSLLPRLHYYTNGTCIVHHLFGSAVCDTVRRSYGDAYLAAHFEVPGEMFRLAMEAKRTRGMGVVGSTSNILDFIAAKVGEALGSPRPALLQFVLGTEAGMITSIVRRVQGMLSESGRRDVEVDIVFPVAPSAISTPQQRSEARGGAPLELPTGLALVPGPAAGEGCSLEGGCASCPYMKMNTLAALEGVCDKIDTPGEALLARFVPRSYAGEAVRGVGLARAGCEPILHMRHFSRTKAMPPGLLQDVAGRAEAAGAGAGKA